MLPDSESAAPSTPPISARGVLLSEIAGSLVALPDMLVQMLPELENGATLAQLKGLSNDDLEETYRVAYGLCAENAWEDALPVLLHLLAHSPFDARFFFAAGMCFQQTQQPMAACVAYGQSLALAPADAATAFRMGESLAALGELRQAAEAFELAADLAAADEDRFHPLLDLARAGAVQLRREIKEEAA
jgi:tetratricopeptide (TPR) repeat protein